MILDCKSRPFREIYKEFSEKFLMRLHGDRTLRPQV